MRSCPRRSRGGLSVRAEAEHVADCGLAEASDRAIWRYVLDSEAVILTKDEDFSVRKTLEPAGPVVVWIRLGNTRREPLRGLLR